MIRANTELTCPGCAGQFVVDFDILEGDEVECPSCDEEFVLRDGKLRLAEDEEDIFVDDDDDDDDEEEDEEDNVHS